MSHSSKLMTISAVTRGLADIRRRLLSEELTVSDYLELFDILADVDQLEVLIRKYRLVVTVDEAQQAVCNVSVKRQHTEVETPFDDCATHSFPGYPWEMTVADAKELSRALDRRAVATQGDL